MSWVENWGLANNLGTTAPIEHVPRNWTGIGWEGDSRLRVSRMPNDLHELSNRTRSISGWPYRPPLGHWEPVRSQQSPAPIGVKEAEDHFVLLANRLVEAQPSGSARQWGRCLQARLLDLGSASPRAFATSRRSKWLRVFIYTPQPHVVSLPLESSRPAKSVLHGHVCKVLRQKAVEPERIMIATGIDGSFFGEYLFGLCKKKITRAPILRHPIWVRESTVWSLWWTSHKQRSHVQRSFCRMFYIYKCYTQIRNCRGNKKLPIRDTSTS